MSEELTFSNPRVQRLRRLIGRRSSRFDEQAFVVEGPSLLAQAAAAGWSIEAQFLAPGAESVVDAPVFDLAPNVIERLGGSEAPQGVVGIVTMRPTALPSAASFVIVADRLADPGNAGTIIRSAEAAGADAVVFTSGSVDVFNPKVVRSTAGSLFRLPVVVAMSIADVQAAGLSVLATSSHRGVVYTEADFTGPVAIVVGNEAHGVDDQIVADGWLTIPHAGEAESLNVAMAATVLAFEVARQRRSR